jgi:hypothetical protein
MIHAPWCKWRDLNPQSYDDESTVLPKDYIFLQHMVCGAGTVVQHKTVNPEIEGSNLRQ